MRGGRRRSRRSARCSRRSPMRAWRRSESPGRCTRRSSSMRREMSIRPALLWCDGRTTAECREITERVGGEDRLRDLASNPALEGFTLPKVLWLRNHEPESFARLSTVLLPKDFIRYKLTGVLATEPSDASATLMYDTARLRWSNEILDAVGLPRSIVPDVGGSSEVLGKVTVEAARPHRACQWALLSSAAARTTRAAPRAWALSCRVRRSRAGARRARCSRRPPSRASIRDSARTLSVTWRPGCGISWASFSPRAARSRGIAISSRAISRARGDANERLTPRQRRSLPARRESRFFRISRANERRTATRRCAARCSA